ncbi:MAG: uroporphyrinogen decarboxylase family protein [Desulfomonile tiedjei]|uniref:Uroporphyrinogen decarboxylase family protein n=1 Tax=Desulfomonile tiedjei TaxID=2358 RepID=A0A9D6Z941_9BACT|nr:uroporphyrinogen decarboxylase family protein [Desulfomonile tiedjei]
MAAMTPRERVQKFFRREPVDAMPVFSGMGLVTIQAINKMGIRFAQVHGSADYLARSAMTSADLFGFDSVIVPYDMCTMAEAMGRGVTVYENAEGVLYPTVPDKWTSLDDVKLEEGWIDKARMPKVEEAFKILLKEANGKYAVGAWVLGPFTLGGQVIELDLLLKGAARDRARVEAFMDKMTDAVIDVAKRYQALGVDYMNVREMGSGTDLLSPRMWKQLIQPYLKRIFDELKSPKILHICGGTDLIVDLMNDCGADALSFDQKNNLVETRKKIGNDVILLGNFDPWDTLCQKEAADVPAVMKACIDAGVDAVWPGCDIWPEVKPENVAAWVNTVREYGKKPSPAVGRI